MEMEQVLSGRYLWQKRKDGSAKLLRVYALHNRLEIPEQLEGHCLTTIGKYCFSGAEHLPEQGVRETIVGDGDAYQEHFHLIAGTELEQLILPDTVREIQDLAFYNCKNLTKLQVGANARHMGSDLFMNCHQLECLEIRCGVEEASGTNAILSRISSEIVVHFLGGRSGTEAMLLYPEYIESYDEIAPAHIFGRNITGEGFRARQLFTEEIVQLDRYDEMIEKIAAEESALTVGRLVLLRLLYPVGLRPQKQQDYERYMRQCGLVTAQYYIDRRDRSILQKMCEERYLQGMDLEEAIQYCVSAGWGEGSASLLDWKQRYDKTDRNNRYSFED